MLQVQYVVQIWANNHFLPINKAFFCKLNDFCFKKVDFLKAEIIKGPITEIKTIHRKRKLHATYIAGKLSIKTGLIFF